MKHKYKVKYYSATPLIKAVHRDKSSSIFCLLFQRKDINIDSKDRNGDGVLAHVASSRNTIYVQTLLDNSRLNVNNQNEKGETPLHRAVKRYPSKYANTNKVV
jgi:ankyrin repeat protein